MSENLTEMENEGVGLLELLEGAVGGALGSVRRGTSAARAFLGLPPSLNVAENLLGNPESDGDEPLYI